MLLIWHYTISNAIYFILMTNKLDFSTYFFFNKSLSASAVVRQLGIHIHVVQRWVKRYYKDSEGVFDKQRKSSCYRILEEEHKHFLLNFIDENPSTVLTEIVESLTQYFIGLEFFHSTVHNFMATECNLFIK